MVVIVTDLLSNPSSPVIEITLAAIAILLCALVVVRVHRTEYDDESVAQVLPMMAWVLLALTSLAALSGLRDLTSCACAPDLVARVLRILIIALAVFSIGGFGHVIWLLYHGHKRD